MPTQTNTKFRRSEFYQRGSKKRNNKVNNNVNACVPTVRDTADVVVQEDVSAAVINPYPEDARANQGVRFRIRTPSRIDMPQSQDNNNNINNNNNITGSTAIPTLDTATQTEASLYSTEMTFFTESATENNTTTNKITSNTTDNSNSTNTNNNSENVTASVATQTTPPSLVTTGTMTTSYLPLTPILSTSPNSEAAPTYDERRSTSLHCRIRNSPTTPIISALPNSPRSPTPTTPLATSVSSSTMGGASSRRRHPECRARPEDPAPHTAVARTGYRRRIDLTQALPYCPVSARNVSETYPYHVKDEQHMRFNNKWNSNKMPRALNYGDRFYATCDFYEFSEPHPDDEVRKVYRNKYHCNRPYNPKPRVQTEGGKFVTVNRMPQFTPPDDYSHLTTYTTYVCFRNINFARLKVLPCDLTDLIMLYAGFEGATVCAIEPLEAGPGKYGLGQVRVVLDRKIDFDKLFLQRPCIMDHNGVFVLKAEHAYDDSYPKETIEKTRKNDQIEQVTYPSEFVQLINIGDQLS